MWFLRRDSPADPDPGEALRGAIRERLERAVAGDPQASSAAADEIRQLMRLLAAYEQTRPPPKRRAWPVVALLLAVAAAVSALLFLRVPTTEVTLALDLASLGFRIGNDPEPGGDGGIELLERVNTNQMAIDAVGAVELEDVPIADATDFRLRATGDGSISLRPLVVPAGTWVRVDRPDPTGALTIELVHPATELEVALTLPAEVEILPADSGLARAFDPGLGAQRAVFRGGRTDGGGCARLRLRWPAAASVSFPAGTHDPAPFRGALPVDALLFTDLEGGAQRTGFSTVLGGTLYLEAVAGREVEIRPDQLLEVGLGSAVTDQGAAAQASGVCAAAAAARPPATAPARILRIAVGADAIALQAGATVSRLSTGTATHRNDLMPRWLEWLQSRQELLLFWGAFGSLFGLAYTVLLWWRGTR
jgi:hypothetical protein